MLQVEDRFIKPLIAKKTEVLVHLVCFGCADNDHQIGHDTLEVSQKDSSRGAFDILWLCIAIDIVIRPRIICGRFARPVSIPLGMCPCRLKLANNLFVKGYYCPRRNSCFLQVCLV
jgi:hypothetical protein